ncbi:hypothetical protein [Pseudoclavibacter sp. AY1H1]|uniref:hypothetical protein n=2 Tax=Pseudoclavibacter TaxID=255204 RepID=UPI000CE7D197|nr:hypothetical protein [Pseudoclavibacter sp. AY1H1]PPF36051.1 hypothetical protein C5E05_11195 [Pseudoclavibacter sp. AY1H1]
MNADATQPASMKQRRSIRILTIAMSVLLLAVLVMLVAGVMASSAPMIIAGSSGCAAIATAWTTGVLAIRQQASKEAERDRRGGEASARLSAPTPTGGTQW